MKGLKQYSLDFDVIDNGNAKALRVVDQSVYIHNPTETQLDVVFPGFKEYRTVPFQFHQLNVYTSVAFDIFVEGKPADFPDGLYKLRYSICPNDELFIEKNYLRTVQTMCELKKILVGEGCSNLNKSLIQDIYFELMAAEAHIELGNIKEGVALFNEVLRSIQIFKRCK